MEIATPHFNSFKIWFLLKFINVGFVLLGTLNILAFPLTTFSQTNDRIQSNASFAEKIYLQLDTKTYTLGNIVWFKCMVLNACDHVPSKLSRVLYAELITPRGNHQREKAD